ncbi:hypothetical protein M8J76_001206 [Diaphorina citri]|nr:hypothetical protein M8J75_014420 [Diaphorina citri]KAI5726355.1 hypothetical protein M8J76_001206 [Diaphorina citri]KAI5731720.1 hypothetical protein M8J77_015043 [Diaphorina citri]
MFVTINRRHEYDFLYSDRECQVVRKKRVSPSREMHLKDILATFDSEDGAIVVDASRRDRKELKEPTLPEDLFDDLECESLHVSELKDENDENIGAQSQVIHDSLFKHRNRTESHSPEPLKMTNPREDYDFFSDFNVKPIRKTSANKSVKADDLKNVLNLFASEDGGYVPVLKKSVEISQEKEPTLPAILMGNSELHVSEMEENNDDSNIKLHREVKSDVNEDQESNIKIVRDLDSEVINSEQTVDRTESSEDKYSKSQHGDLNDIYFPSNLYHKKTFKTTAGSSENILLKGLLMNRKSTQPRHSISTSKNRSPTQNEIDMIVENFISVQRKFSLNTVRPVTHFLNVSNEESYEKYTFRKRKGKTKTTRIKTTKYSDKSTKRRGRPKKTTTPSGGIISSPSKNTRKHDKKYTTNSESIQTSVSNIRDSTSRNLKTKSVNIEDKSESASTATLKTIGKEDKDFISRPVKSSRVSTKIQLDHSVKKSQKQGLTKYESQPSSTSTSTDVLPAHKMSLAPERKIAQFNNRNKLVLLHTKTTHVKTVPSENVQNTKGKFELLKEIKFERTGSEDTSEDVEESGFFTVEPIPDSNLYNEWEYRPPKRKVKTSTFSLKSLKNLDDKLSYIREVCGEHMPVNVTKKASRKNVFSFKLNEIHVGTGKIENRLGCDSSNETSYAEVEEVPIIDFNDPFRILEHKRRQDQYPWNFKIGSWNVNGIRAWSQKDGFSFMRQHDLNVFCIQEIRCPLEKLPECPEGYHAFWFPGTRQGYAGVAVLSKTKPVRVTHGFSMKVGGVVHTHGFNRGSNEHGSDMESGPSHPELTTIQYADASGIDDGRVMTVEYEQFYLVNVYAPAAKEDLSMLSVKLLWNSFLRGHLRSLNEIKPVVLAGDLNVAHNHIDVALPLTNLGKSGFTIQERNYFSNFLDLGFLDVHRHLYPNHRIYTYWPYYDRPSKMKGWRLDYFLISKQLESHLSDLEIHGDVEGSDHAPQILYLNL